MVDGDEPRMSKCRKAVLWEEEYSVIVLPYARSIKVGTKIFQLEKWDRQGSFSEEKMDLQERTFFLVSDEN